MWPQIIAMVASAALSANAQSQAAKKQQQAARDAQQRQLNSRNQATDAAMKRVEEFDPNTRQTKQTEIGAQLEGQYNDAAQAAPVTAQGVQVGQTIPGGTPDYLVTKAKESAKTQASLRALASLMSRIGSANELRRGEAVGIGDTAGEIGRIQTGANNVGQIDQIGIDAAGQPSLGAMLASSALGAYGMSGMMTAGLGGAAPAGTGINPAAATGLGLKSGMGVGLKAGAGSWLGGAA